MASKKDETRKTSLNNLVARIFGWMLLLGGIALIGWTLLNSYKIFTGQVEAPQIIKSETRDTPSPSLNIPTGELDIQKQMESLLQTQLRGFLPPAGSIPKLLNLVISSVLAGILVFGGGQISTLGIRLIK